MKRYRMIPRLAAAAVLVMPALGWADFGPPPVRGYEAAPATTLAAPPVMAVTAPPAPDAIHSGASNSADEALADSVAAALAADSRLHGATITVAANNGRVSLSGSARSPEQGSHAESIARSIAGVTAVSGTLDSQGG
jgi:hypothetical protein